jgi:VIT1/CCC1 family predicted Fe2+/Mn2+ transporter
VSRGVPDANRIMLDIWIAEAQLLSGALYVAAWRSRRTGSPWRGLAAFGALTMIGFAVPILPVLIARAPLIFWIPAIVYLALSLVIVTVTVYRFTATKTSYEPGSSSE